MLYGENKLSEDFDCLVYSDSNLLSFFLSCFCKSLVLGPAIASDEVLLFKFKNFPSVWFESLRRAALWLFDVASDFVSLTGALIEALVGVDSFTNDSAVFTKGSNAVGWANTCVFTFDEDPIQEGVEEDEEDADTDVKDVEHDDAFLKELEFEEFGGESERILFVFRQDVKVM